MYFIFMSSLDLLKIINLLEALTLTLTLNLIDMGQGTLHHSFITIFVKY